MPRAFGIRLPLSDSAPRFMALCEGEREHIRQSIAMILRTRLGTRPLVPDYGCRIHDLLFRPLAPELRGQAAFFVEEALRRWEPRVDVEEVVVGPVPGQPPDPYTLRVTVRYRRRQANDDPDLIVLAFADGVGTTIAPWEVVP